MSEILEQIEELYSQAYRLRPGPAKVSLFEEAVRLADTHNMPREAYELRKELIEAAIFGGLPEKALVNFSTCLGQCDRAPDEFPETDLLWTYKWIVNELPGFPQIRSAQIQQVLDDMETRFRRNGYNERMAHKYRCRAAYLMGGIDEARRYRQAWDSKLRDGMSDCPACEVDAFVEYLIVLGQYEEALEHVQPIVAGRLTCGEVPHVTLNLLLLPLLKLGRAEEAMEHHRRGYRLVSNNQKFLRCIAKHLTFMVLTDNLSTGVKMLEKHLPWALETADLSQAFDFHLACLFLCQRWQAAGKNKLKCRLPRAFPLHQAEGEYAVEALAGCFKQQAEDLARRFDERNGNQHFRQRIEELPELEKLITPCPLRAKSDTAE